MKNFTSAIRVRKIVEDLGEIVFRHSAVIVTNEARVLEMNWEQLVHIACGIGTLMGIIVEHYDFADECERITDVEVRVALHVAFQNRSDPTYRLNAIITSRFFLFLPSTLCSRLPQHWTLTRSSFVYSSLFSTPDLLKSILLSCNPFGGYRRLLHDLTPQERSLEDGQGSGSFHLSII